MLVNLLIYDSVKSYTSYNIMFVNPVKDLRKFQRTPKSVLVSHLCTQLADFRSKMAVLGIKGAPFQFFPP